MSECSHQQCAICLLRSCTPGIGSIKKVGQIYACYSCVSRAVAFALQAAQTYGGEYPEDECWYKAEKRRAEGVTP